MLRRFPVPLLAVLVACSSATPPPTASPRPTAQAGSAAVVAFGGDVNLGRRQNAISARDGFQDALGDVTQLGSAHLAIANLESVVSGIGTAGVEKGEAAPFYFRGRPEMVNVLTAAGIDAVATANNHSGDYGPEALLDQLRLLEEAGIAQAGAGVNVSEACRHTLVGAGALTVALVAVDATMPFFAAGEDVPGTCHLALDDPEPWRDRIGPILESAARESHVVLVAVHWGPNFRTEPSEAKRAIGRLLIDLGADAVLGSSAHDLQGVEVHAGRPILHDAGNLLFDSQEGSRDSALFLLDITPDGVERVRVEPLISDYGITYRASAEDAERILDQLTRRSSALGTTLIDGSLQLDPPRAAPGPTPVQPPRRHRAEIQPATTPPPGCVIDAVPPGARIEPIRLDSLTLLGVDAADPPIRADRQVWVETFWEVDATPSEDLWLSPRLESTDGGSAWRGDHEPCDWGWPATRLRPGTIYRDKVALRPREDPGRELLVRVGVTNGNRTIELSDEISRVPVE